MSIEMAMKRGRPPTYDRDRALTALTDMFWKNGFASTSLDELSAATGMARPSLYAAFGDKQAMYISALDRVRGMLAAELEALNAEPDLAKALRTFYLRATNVYLSGGDQPRGCLAICTAVTAATTHADIRVALADILAMIDRAFIARFKRSRDELLLAQDHDIQASGSLAAAALHSLAIRARSGSSRTELAALIDAVINVTMGRPLSERNNPNA